MKIFFPRSWVEDDGFKAISPAAGLLHFTQHTVAGRAGTDTIGYNLMLIVAAAICIATAAGRKYGLDKQLIDRFPKNQTLRLVA